MGSSGGGTPRQPDMPVPQGNVVPYGQTSPAMQPQMSFLPTDPSAVATGLTPEMVAAINKPPPPPPVMVQQAAAPVQNKQDGMRTLLAMLMGGQGRQGLSRGGGDRGSSGYGGSASGGPGGFGGSSARGGRAY